MLQVLIERRHCDDFSAMKPINARVSALVEGEKIGGLTDKAIQVDCDSLSERQVQRLTSRPLLGYETEFQAPRGPRASFS